MMLKHSITALAAICFVSVLASAAQAQSGIVFAGRAEESVSGKKAHVTFVGDVDELGNATGRLVIGGYFVTADATGFAQFNADGSLNALWVSADDPDRGTWQLTVNDNSKGHFFTITAPGGPVELGYDGSGTNFITNVH